MANRGCTPLELDESKYSSPMPLIGLYIAAGSLLCFLAMLFDISSAFRHKKTWLPCRLFTLNSVSLTLLAIATKLPVDLTASMPSTLDQFSKLSGMAFICISMGFLSPSLGMTQKSEVTSNMIALSILVVTVIVNICIQIRTRVILLFITEHIIIMVCLLALLASLWLSSVAVANDKSYSLDNNKDLLRKGKGSMLARLKLSYLYGFDNNPQFLLCKNIGLCAVAGICMVCSGVIIQAAFRNLSVDFCNGKSDYGWSMWVIVAVQTLSIVVGCLAIVFRWVAMSVRINLRQRNQSMAAQASYDISRNPELRLGLKGRCKAVLMGVLALVGGLSLYLFILPFMLLLGAAKFVIRPCLKNKYKDNEDIKEYKDLVVKDDKGMEEWVVSKSVQEMNRWIEISKCYSPNHLVGLLSVTVPSQEVDSVYLKGLHVSTLSLALLARLAQVSLPSEDYGQSLVAAYSEVCEILHFIEDRTKSNTSQYVYAREIAKAVRRGNGYGSIFIKASIIAEAVRRGSGYDDLLTEFSETDPLRRALSVLAILKTSNIWNEIRKEVTTMGGMITESEYWKEVVLLVNFLLAARRYTSIEDLSKQIQQVFVDMFHSILAQLPQAIFNDVVDSIAEDFDKSVKRSMGVLCQVQLLQHSIRWICPVESDITQATVKSLWIDWKTALSLWPKSVDCGRFLASWPKRVSSGYIFLVLTTYFDGIIFPCCHLSRKCYVLVLCFFIISKFK